ncbi:MAG: FkbM family methyltransferase [Thermoanaerobaculia bacterium]|nr:FkbM family methyltransferase [Thermoanaerobaculia bacterium]
MTVPLLAKLVRLYTFHTPVRRGRHRLANLAIARWRNLPDALEVFTRGGDRLVVDPRSTMWRYAYFHGEYEPALTRLTTRVVGRGDTCLDIGANIGWYTVLLRRLVGSSGAVHAFEPNPPVFARLVENVALAGAPPNVYLHPLGLGRETRAADLHVFEGIADGHASMSDQGRAGFSTVSCPVRRLDDVLKESGLDRVSFVKMDVEGAELGVLEGAGRLFSQPTPPVWLIEMARETARTFGYGPGALVDFLRSSAAYRFFAVDEAAGRLHEIQGFPPGDVGANVLCVPVSRADLMAALGDGTRV